MPPINLWEAKTNCLAESEAINELTLCLSFQLTYIFGTPGIVSHNFAFQGQNFFEVLQSGLVSPLISSVSVPQSSPSKQFQNNINETKTEP